MKMKDNIYVTRAFMPPYEEYIQEIKALWDTHWITNMGSYHERLEKELCSFLQVPNVSLMSNGHMALELTLQAMDFPIGSEIITTPFTFVSTTHAIVRNGFKAVFCDVKESDGTIDENKIESLITDKTAAIVPVHVYGNICNVVRIQKIAEQYGLKVIYDAAHAFGEAYKGKGIGNYGDASVFSFHATKVFNTIEGGASVFRDTYLYERLYNLKNFGIRGEEEVVEVGANAKLNEFSAIMGLCNLKYVKDVISERKKRYYLYKSLFAEIRGIRLLEQNEDVEYNYAYMPIVIEDNYALSRDTLYGYLRKNGIHTRKYFYPLVPEQQCYFKQFGHSFVPCAKNMSDRILVLPLYDGLSVEDIERIVRLIKFPG